MTLRRLPLELLIWSGAIVVLAVSYPKTANHFTFCPLDNLGFDWCPGCGLGRSVSYFLHGEILRSIEHHWFGIPAFFILVHRIVQLLSKFVLHLLRNNQKRHAQRASD